MEGHDVKKWSIRDIIDLEYFFHKDAVIFLSNRGPLFTLKL